MVEVQTEVYYFDDGALSMRYEFYPDNRDPMYCVVHGIYESYWEDGTTEEIGFYKHNVEVGFGIKDDLWL